MKKHCLSEKAVAVACAVALQGFETNFGLDRDGVTFVEAVFSPVKYRRMVRRRFAVWRMRVMRRRRF